MRKLLASIALFLLPSVAFGAITATNLTASSSAVSASSYVTDPVTFGTNKLQLLFIGNYRAAGATEPTVTGCGLTPVKVTSTIGNAASDRSTVFRAMGTGTTCSFTIDFSGVAQTQVAWSWSEFDGVDTTGSNGSGAVPQFCGGESHGAGKTTSTCVLSSPLGTGSASYGASFWATGGSPTLTAGNGYTILAQKGQSIVVGGDEWNVNGSTTVSITSSAADEGTITGLEIKAPTAAAGATTHLIRGNGRTRNNAGR